MSTITKVYTDHALMDEIVYNAKKILSGIVLKNDASANSNETSDSISESEYYISIKSGNTDLYTVPMTTNLLIAYGFTALEASVYVDDRSQLVADLTETQQSALLTYLSDYYVNNYIEKNNYYRMINGKSNYNPEDDSSLSYYKISAKIWDDNKGSLVDGELAFTDYLSGFYGKAYVKVYDTTLQKYTYKTLYLLSYNIFLYSIPVVYGDGSTDTIKISYEQFNDNTFCDYYATLLNANFASEELQISTSIEHLLDYQLNTMDSIGILDDLKTKFITDNTVNPSKFRYLKYLGAKSINIYTARSAHNWDILYIPTVEYLVESRFKELFMINRDIYERRTYQDAYKLKSEYFDEIMMIMIISQTFADLIVDVPEWYIRRDIFDLRFVKYFLDSQGVEYFDDIPLKYQIRIVKNLNKLIKYKSTEKNIQDILDIFSIDNAEIYKYYILKKYLYTDHTSTDPVDPDPEWSMDDEYDFGFQNEYIDMDDETVYNTGDGSGGDSAGYDVYEFGDDSSNIDYGDTEYDYEFGDEDGSTADDSSDTDRKDEYDESNTVIKDEYDNVYELQFVKVPVDDQYDDYIKDSINRKDYDALTENDPYWDGIDLHSLVKNNHLKKDFTIEGTKYLGIEYEVSMEEYKFQTAYFMGMIFNSNIDMSDISIPVSTIKQDAYFTLQSLFVFIYCCNRLYENKSMDIFDPRTLEQTGTKPDYCAYNDCNGGRPWNNSSDPEPDNNDDDTTWELPDIDGGYEDDADFSIDSSTEVIDFGNGDYVIDPTETLYNYDYKEITDTSIEDETIIAQEKTEPAAWPPQDDLDYGNEDTDIIYRSDYTVTYDFYTEDKSYTPDTDSYLYDYNNEVYNQVTDLPETGDSETTYYVQSSDLVRFAVYSWNSTTSTYDLLYSQTAPDPGVIVIDGTITVTLTTDNYKTYIGHYLIQDDDSLLLLTSTNILNYIGQRVDLKYPWYNEEQGYLSLDIDGHNLYQDNDKNPVYYDIKSSSFKHVSDDSAVTGDVSVVSSKYVQDYDCGGVEPLNSESYYDWIRTDHSNLYTNLTGRVLSFNMYTNPSTGETIKDTIATNIGIRHSIFGWDRGYTLEEVGCTNYKVQTSFSTITELISVYNTNKTCYDTLRDLMMNASTRDSYLVYKYVFEQLFTRDYDANFYVLNSGSSATNFLQILKDKDITLYNYYILLASESDEDTRTQEIRSCLNDIVSTLSYYLSDDNVKYVLSFIYTNSFDSLLYYMGLLLNFFKSWKTYFLDSVVTYTLDDKNDHNAIGHDTMNEMKIKYWTTGNGSVSDSFQTTVIRTIDDTPETQQTRNKEIIDVAAHYIDNDISNLRDYNGGSVENTVSATVLASEDAYEDIDGGGVSKISCSPFYQIDGRGIGDRLDIYDLDGGFPKNSDYSLDIDGLRVNDPKAFKPLEGIYGQDLDLGVDVDGGHPDFRQVTTNTTVTKADKNNNLTVNAKISTYDDNAIVVKDDGLYLKDTFANTSSLSDLASSMLAYKINKRKVTSSYINDCAVLSNPQLAKERVDDIYADKFSNAIYIMNTFKYTDVEGNLTTTRDNKIAAFKTWFNESNPFEYEEVTV